MHLCMDTCTDMCMGMCIDMCLFEGHLSERGSAEEEFACAGAVLLATGSASHDLARSLGHEAPYRLAGP